MITEHAASMNGKARKPGNIRGRKRVVVSDGFVSITQAVLAGIAMEKSGLAAPAVAKRLNIGLQSYARIRDVVLLAQRDDLSAEDAATVERIAVDLNKTGHINKHYNSIRSITKKIWGERYFRLTQKSKTPPEAFLSSIAFVLTTCAATMDLVVPYLGDSQRNIVLNDIQEAMQALRAIEERVKNGVVK